MTQTPESCTEGETRPESDETKQCLRVEATVELPPGAEVQLTVTYKSKGKAPVRSQVINLTGGEERSSKHLQFDLASLPRIDLFFVIKNWMKSLWGWFTSLSIPPVGYLVGAILIYYIVRLIHLTDFPIFFFTDEAIQTMRAFDLKESGFAAAGGEFLPTFFKNGGMYNLGTSVYLQIPPALLGIRSPFVTRLISTTVTLLAAASLGLSYGVIKNNRRGWIAVLVLSMIPAWFYHSRTAFETVDAVSFYSVFLYGYLRYRNGSFRWIYVSVAAAALAFYGYSPARVVMAATAVALLVSDFQFHWNNRKTLWLPILIGILFCIPYFRFLYLHPGENEYHLSLLDSYWVKPVPFYEKIFTFLRTYLNGLNPVYWFFFNPSDLSRHIMKGMGHLGWFFLPFFAAGFFLAIRKWKDTNYRLMLLAMLTAPVGAAVADISITRALFMVIPAAFFIALGIDYVIDWLKKHLPAIKLWESLVFLVLAAGNFFVLDISLTYGPTWYTDYGMGGMQYGGKQVFSRIKELQEQNPDLHINMSPDWANGTDVLARFFLGDPVPIEMSGMSDFINDMKPSTEDTLFVIARDDLTNVANSGKFEPMKVSDVIFYPDGTPGFVFARLKYKEAAKLVFEQERASRKLMVPENLTINGVKAEGASSRLDMGSLQQVFDNKQDTLIRTEEANPLVVEVKLQNPIPVKMITAIVGGNATGFTVYAQTEDGSKSFSSSITVNDKTQIQTVHVPVKLDQDVSRLRFEIRSIHDGEPTHVHLWDIKVE